VLFLLLALSGPAALPFSDGGGFSLGHGTVLQGAVAGGADVLPARIGGMVTVTQALSSRVDLALALSGGAVTSNIATVMPTLALRWGVWQADSDGVTVRLSVGLPVSILVAPEVSATRTSSQTQARLEGVPVELIAAYSHWFGAHLELGALIPLRVFPAVTSELSYGAGLGGRLGVHFLTRFMVALEATARLEHTTYAPTGFGIGAGLFVLPAGQLSFSVHFGN